MIRFYLLAFDCLLLGCSDDALQEDINILENSLAGKNFVTNNVIACAALNQSNDNISVFFYPRPGVTNIQYFETENVEVDKNDFQNYMQYSILKIVLVLSILFAAAMAFLPNIDPLLFVYVTVFILPVIIF
jgi:hypothetical protein